MTKREPVSPGSESSDVVEEYRLLRSSQQAAVEPWALLQAVRDAGGRIVDFVYHDINVIAAGQTQQRPEDLIGRSLAETLPEVARMGLIGRYARCVETGEPLIIDGLPYHGRTLDGPERETHRYEVRGVRVGTEFLSLNWRDTNHRYLAREDVRQASEVLRATLDSMLDPQMLLEAVRDPAGRVVDLRYREANDAACKDMLMTRDELIGRTVLELLPGFAESGPLSYYIQCLETGQPGALDDYSYDNEIHAESRRYDVRIAPAGHDLISLTFRDVTERFQATQRAVEAQILLRATVDSMLNPQSLLEAVRDSAGQVIDFVYRSANLAFCSRRGREEHDIIGTSVLEAQPGLLSSGLFERYVHCADTGESVALDDAAMSDSIYGVDRRFDIRVVRAGVDLISLTFSDVTDRYQAAQRIAESEEHYRMLALNVTDAVLHIRDGVIVWASPAIEQVLGAPPAHWIGTLARDATPPEDLPASAERWAILNAGGEVQQRIRLNSADGVTHWIHAHGKPFYDAEGHRDGVITALRLVDDEVATEQAADEARRRQARADALYRRLLENAAVGVCLINPEGRFVDVNDAVCEFFGYDAETLKGKTWQELTAEAYLEADLAKVADVLAGRIESYRMTKQYIHADGHPLWGDLAVSCIRDDTGQVEMFISHIVDVNDEVQAREDLADSRRLLAASADSMLDPQVLFEAVRDPSGRIVDFTYISANRATCIYLQVDEDQILGASAMDSLPNLEGSGLLARYADCVETGEPVILTDFSYFNEMLDDARRYDIRATRAGDNLLSLTWTDVTERYQAARRLATSEEQYRLLAMNSTDVVVHIRDGIALWVSPSVEHVLGAPPEHWLGRHIRELVPPEDHADFDRRWSTAATGDPVQERSRLIGTDGVIHWFHLRITPFYDGEGQQDGSIATMRLIDAEVAAEQASDESRRQKARSDALYRRSVDNAAVGMCLADLEGNFVEANRALCEFFGYDADTLLQMTWLEVTDPEYLEADLDNRAKVLAGDIESYRMVKRFIHADGHPIWGDLAVSCLRDDTGQVELFIGEVTDITDRVEADERLRLLNQLLEEKSKRVTTELESAATYMSSLMPKGLSGPVTVSSRYLPSQELGGDCLDFYWIDDDHLLLKLIDVSGHGIEPALLAVSVHNLMRSGSLDRETMLSPEAVLTKLNGLFGMDDQQDHYFTMWYSIYQPSTRTLRYASAGCPPALAFNTPTGNTVTSTALSTPAAPIGMFEDTAFTSGTYHVPHGCRMLIYSDGASEITLSDDHQLTGSDFRDLASRVAASSDWSLDDLIAELRALTPSGSFEDDCSLIRVQFD